MSFPQDVTPSVKIKTLLSLCKSPYTAISLAFVDLFRKIVSGLKCIDTCIDDFSSRVAGSFHPFNTFNLVQQHSTVEHC